MKRDDNSVCCNVLKWIISMNARNTSNMLTNLSAKHGLKKQEYQISDTNPQFNEGKYPVLKCVS